MTSHLLNVLKKYHCLNQLPKILPIAEKMDSAVDMNACVEQAVADVQCSKDDVGVDLEHTSDAMKQHTAMQITESTNLEKIIDAVISFLFRTLQTTMCAILKPWSRMPTKPRCCTKLLNLPIWGMQHSTKLRACKRLNMRDSVDRLELFLGLGLSRQRKECDWYLQLTQTYWTAKYQSACERPEWMPPLEIITVFDNNVGGA